MGTRRSRRSISDGGRCSAAATPGPAGGAPVRGC